MENLQLTQEQQDFIRNDLQGFAEIFFQDVLKDKIPAFHKEIYGMIPKEMRVVLAAPRGFAKSTIICIIYPLWLALFAKRRDICLISASETLAVELLRKIKRELESNLLLQAAFGDVRSAKWTENHIILKNGVEIRAKGAGGQIRGFRPDTLLLDDIETDESVESEEQRKKLKEWLFKACLNTLLPEGQLIIIGTVIHPLSVLADLLEIDNGWIKRKYQAYIDGIEKEGNELWPDARNHEWLQQRKAEIGTWAFASEFLNNPIADESSPIKPENIRYWKELPAQYSGVISVDPAYSEDNHADYKVASLIAMDQQSNRYLVHYIRTHEPIGVFQDAILNLWQSNKGFVTSVGIPNAGVEKGFYDSFLKKCEERKLFPPVVELKNVYTNAQTSVSTRNKKARVVSALQPLFQQGKYYIHADHLEARDELLTIGSSRWDDVVDTMAYAEQILTPTFYEEKHDGDLGSTPQTILNYGLGY